MAKSDTLYQQIEQWDLIAAQYVLGTLSASARQNFELKLQENSLLRELTYDWERRLSPLAESLMPQQVPASVWKNIERRLAWRPTTQSVPRRWLQETPFWWGAGITALAACVLMVVFISAQLWPTVTQQPTGYTASMHAVAVLKSEHQQVSWVVQRQGNQLLLSALTADPVAANKDLELWSIAPHGQPRSLGVLHLRAGQAVFAKVDPQLLQQNLTLAISLEPKHGSPTGLPTGAVLYTGKIDRI